MPAVDTLAAAKAAIIGLVEGLTEFLPISSTGHIIVAERALGFADRGEVFAVVIQLGAILAVCWYYRARLWKLLRDLPSDPGARRFATSLLIAILPAVVVGLKLNSWLEKHVFAENATAVIAATTAIGGFLILLIESRKAEPRWTDVNALPWRTALGIGLFQLLALIPGTSRSGATIMGALLLGVERRVATEFSFFLAIPVMIGASALKLWKHKDEIDDAGLGLIAIGFLVSFAVALAVVHWLLRYVSRHSFAAFGWYRIAAGILLAIAILAGWLAKGGG
jgi:undecaprenyl-diphosphatase